MRFIHTADWHLGRIFHGQSLVEDQVYVLEKFIALVKESRVDAVVVSGDIYDRAVPPPEAVSLLDHVLTEIVLGAEIPVIAIAGNHDSPDRLNFGSRLLSRQGLYVTGSLSDRISEIRLSDEHGPVRFYAIPYAEPALVRERMGLEGVSNHDAAMRRILKGLPNRGNDSVRTVLMAHAFVAGGSPSESERPLTIGGAGTVDVACFTDFDYVALGHLHRPQIIGGEKIHYSGSLLKYSFAEAAHDKSVTMVEIGTDGDCRTESIQLSPRHDVRCIEGTFDEVMLEIGSDESRNDYISVTLLDRIPILDAMGKLRTIYPNVLEVIPARLFDTGDTRSSRIDHRKMDEAALFSAFFQQMTNEPMNDAQVAAFARVLDEVLLINREVVTE